MFVKLTHNNTNKLFQLNYQSLIEYATNTLALNKFQFTFHEQAVAEEQFIIDDQESLYLIASLLKEVDPATSYIKVNINILNDNLNEQQKDISQIIEKEVQPQVQENADNQVIQKEPELKQEFNQEQLAQNELKEIQSLVENKVQNDGLQQEIQAQIVFEQKDPVEIAKENLKKEKNSKSQDKIRKIVQEELAIFIENSKQKPSSSKDQKTIHHGIRCDGCNMHPIIGIRYKSSIQQDFDFCENCEATKTHAHAFVKLKTPQQAQEYIRNKAYPNGCGKSRPSCHPLFQQFNLPQGIPLHQFGGFGNLGNVFQTVVEQFAQCQQEQVQKSKEEGKEKKGNEKNEVKKENLKKEKQTGEIFCTKFYQARKMAMKVKKLYPMLEEETIYQFALQNPELKKKEIIEILISN